ncbi:MAG: Peroxisome biosynthesis protein pex1 [Chaenotheca gracillima]|nr:MAG: Peroxisome biosynthesis protein pex1 [Chaenotheca gracillima]
MASSNCWRCLLRPSYLRKSTIPIPPSSTTHRSLSTTASLAANPPKAKGGGGHPSQKGSQYRAGVALKIKKKTFVKTGRPPAPGERKAARKRIVLSNPNALAVQGVEDLTAETSSAQTLSSLQDRIVGIPGEVVDQLRAAEAFKPAQRWSRFRRPCTLMTKESIMLAEQMRNAEGKQGGVRKLFSGEKASGKSMLLLQAQALAFARKWIVISIPEAQEISNGHTEYSPLPKSEPTSYIQRTFVSNLLSSIAKANTNVLKTLTLSQEHNLSIPVQSNMSLDRFVSLGASDPDLAWPIYNAFWTELAAPGRPPVLYCLDDVDHIMHATAYLDPSLEPIHAHDLALVKHFLDHLSGIKNSAGLPNGGLVLAATTRSNFPAIPTLKLALRQAEARSSQDQSSPTQRLSSADSAEATQVSLPFADPDPYQPLDPRVLAAMENVPVTRVKGLDRSETRALLEYYASSGVMRERIDEAKIVKMRALSGGGLIGEIERGVLGG